MYNVYIVHKLSQTKKIKASFVFFSGFFLVHSKRKYKNFDLGQNHFVHYDVLQSEQHEQIINRKHVFFALFSY